LVEYQNNVKERMPEGGMNNTYQQILNKVKEQGVQSLTQQEADIYCDIHYLACENCKPEVGSNKNCPYYGDHWKEGMPLPTCDVWLLRQA
jgi:hypothetical protein